MSSGMASWEPASTHPPRTSSRQWYAPGLFVNVDFAVSFGQNHKTHNASMTYTSKRMEAKLAEESRRRYEQGLYQQQHPAILTPGYNVTQEHQARYLQQQQAAHVQRQKQQRRLAVNTREQYGRATSAPPTVTDRTQPISPVSPISPMSPIATLRHNSSTINPTRHSPSPLTSSNVNGPMRHTSSLPIGRKDQALPPSPSQFRLGEDDLPWSTPAWYRSPEPENASLAVPRAQDEPPVRRLDDPQRVRDLGTLQQAMMTIDSLENDGWEPWTWDSVGDMPRGPRSLGWAVSSNDAPSREVIAASLDRPPSYNISQWEEIVFRERSRPRSSGI